MCNNFKVCQVTSLFSFEMCQGLAKPEHYLSYDKNNSLYNKIMAYNQCGNSSST